MPAAVGDHAPTMSPGLVSRQREPKNNSSEGFSTRFSTIMLDAIRERVNRESRPGVGAFPPPCVRPPGVTLHERLFFYCEHLLILAPIIPSVTVVKGTPPPEATLVMTPLLRALLGSRLPRGALDPMAAAAPGRAVCAPSGAETAKTTSAATATKGRGIASERSGYWLRLWVEVIGRGMSLPSNLSVPFRY